MQAPLPPDEPERLKALNPHDTPDTAPEQESDEITERRQIESALRESEERFSGAFEHAPIGMALVSPDGRWKQVNRAICDLVGYTEAELLTKTFQDITHREDLNTDLDNVRRMLAGEIRTYQMEKRYIHARGYFVPVLLYVSLVRDTQSRPLYFVAQIQDLTERKRTEEIVNRLAAIIEDSDEAIISKTLEGIITSWNPAAEKMFGYSASEIIGQRLQVLIPLDRPDEESEILAGFKRGEHVRHFETMRVRKNGQRFDASVSISPIKDSGGKIVGVSNIVRDITERNRASALLIESRQRLALATESAQIGIWDWDVAANRMIWDKQMYELYGIREQDFSHAIDAWQKGLHSEDRSRVEAEIASALAGFKDFHTEFRIVWPNGEIREIEARGIVRRANDGSGARMIGVNWDITGRKRAENALRESNEKFHQLADNITDVFWVRSPDMRELQYISPAFERIWGRTPESLIANPLEWSNFILPEDRVRAVEAFAALTGDAQRIDIEYRILRPDGEIRWVRTRGFQVRDAADNLVRLIGVVTDVTERQHAAEELRESERRFGAMLRNLELVSRMLDRDGRITYCNDYLLRVTGWRREELIGRDWFQLFLPADQVVASRSVHAALLADQPAAAHHENEILTKSGARRLIRWNNSVLRSASGDSIGTASIGEDITERKQLEAQLFQSQKMETVGKLAGGIAHEFNGILTAIIGQSELMLGGLPADHPLFRNAAGIHKAAERAAMLTGQLLAYGRRAFLRPELLNLNEVIANMASIFPNLVGNSVELSIVPAAELHAVKADAGQIEQVIMNLVMNAAEAMPNGGKITFETANVAVDEEDVGRFPELKAGKYAMLAINDTGAGMSAEVKARAFEPFFTTKGAGQGTGLGLSTCYGIIKQSGGQISVTSELGRGTTINVYLPQVTAKLPESADGVGIV